MNNDDESSASSSDGDGDSNSNDHAIVVSPDISSDKNSKSISVSTNHTTSALKKKPNLQTRTDEIRAGSILKCIGLWFEDVMSGDGSDLNPPCLSPPVGSDAGYESELV